MNRSLVDEVRDRLQLAVERFTAARASYAAALTHRELAVARAEHRLTGARGTLPPRPTVAAGHRSRVHTVADALVVARSVRAAPVIHDARCSLEATRATENARVQSTAAELEAAAWHLRSFGALGRRIVDAASKELTAGRNDPLGGRPPADRPRGVSRG